MKKYELDKNFKHRNSSMAENVEKMKNLGNRMEYLRKNKELKEDQKVPDPGQYKDADQNLRRS